MKKKGILALVLSLCMVLALVPVAALAAEFTDIDEATNASYADAIERWADEGVITGDGNDAFNPQGKMSRIEGFAIIANLLNLVKEDDLSAFDDIPTVEWERAAAAKVVAAGIVTGIPTLDENGETVSLSLAPHGELTREQMFVTIAKTLGVNPVEEDAEDFDDIGDAADYAAPYIKALHKMGAVKGSNNEVNPLGLMTREGAALLLDNLIGGYANETGDTVEIGEDGKITLVVADNVTVTGDANDMPIVVSGEAGTVDMKGVTGTPTVNVTVSDVAISGAPVGTEITASETAENVTANGIDVSADPDKDVVVPEPAPPYNPPVVVDTNKAEEAADDTWTALKGILTDLGLQDLIIADGSNGTYTLTLDADKISASEEAVGSEKLEGLMTEVKKALDEKFGEATLKIKVGEEELEVYAEKQFNNTNLKAALVDVANGFFVKLSEMTPDDNDVYTYKELEGTVTAPDGSATDTKPVSLTIQLKGDDVEKVQALAGKLATYLSMKQMTVDEIKETYGTGDILENVTGEDKYIVIGVEMPPSLLNALKEHKNDKDAFEKVTVGAALNVLGSADNSSIFGEDDAPNIKSLLGTINSNSALINKVLSKMTSIKVGGIELTSKEFNPTGQSEWQKFFAGVTAMFGSGKNTIGNTNIGSYALTKEEVGSGYYAVPVTVTIDLQASMGFNATETIVVILHIPFGG